MEASNVGKVGTLMAKIAELQQAIYAIDNGAAIVAMTLRREEIPPVMAPAESTLPRPSVDSEEDEEQVPGPDEEQRLPEMVEVEPGVPAIELTISTEGLVHPPQMMASIRAQEVQLWQAAYEELAQLGVTNVSQPPAAAPAAAVVTPARPVVRPAPRPGRR